jgi:hypothetical protein
MPSQNTVGIDIAIQMTVVRPNQIQTSNMTNMIKLAGVAAVALVLSQSIQATPITGNIGFTGGVTFNNNSAGNASAVTSWITPTVNLPPTGSFASILSGTAVNFSSSIWNFNTSTPINNFWSVGGFTFELLASSITSQGGSGPGGGFIVVNGTGTVSGNGYTPTTLSWSFSSQDPKINSNPDTWTFSASASSIPDGGATVMLLGLALSGVALLRKKLTA